MALLGFIIFAIVFVFIFLGLVDGTDTPGEVLLSIGFASFFSFSVSTMCLFLIVSGITTEVDFDFKVESVRKLDDGVYKVKTKDSEKEVLISSSEGEIHLIESSKEEKLVYTIEGINKNKFTKALGLYTKPPSLESLQEDKETPKLYIKNSSID